MSDDPASHLARALALCASYENVVTAQRETITRLRLQRDQLLALHEAIETLRQIVPAIEVFPQPVKRTWPARVCRQCQQSFTPIGPKNFMCRPCRSAAASQRQTARQQREAAQKLQQRP